MPFGFMEREHRGQLAEGAEQSDHEWTLLGAVAVDGRSHCSAGADGERGDSLGIGQSNREAGEQSEPLMQFDL